MVVEVVVEVDEVGRTVVVVVGRRVVVVVERRVVVDVTSGRTTVVVVTVTMRSTPGRMDVVVTRGTRVVTTVMVVVVVRRTRSTIVVVVVVVVVEVVEVVEVVVVVSGAGGGVTPVVAVTTVDASPSPNEFTARICTEYWVPSVRPEIINGEVTTPAPNEVHRVPLKEYS